MRNFLETKNMSLKKTKQNRLKKIFSQIEQELLIDYQNLDIRVISHSLNFESTEKTEILFCSILHV